MDSTAEWLVRLATANDAERVAGLLSGAGRIHQHLDWARPLDLLGEEPFLIATHRGLPVGCLACPPDPPPAAWIRLFASASGYSTGRMWTRLWNQARRMVAASGVGQVAAIGLVDWLPPLLEASGFEPVTSVVFYEWHTAPMSQAPGIEPELRRMQASDLEAVQRVDHAAFSPIWRHSQRAFRLAFDQAAYASVLETSDQIIAYQISTATKHAAHLARLAVDPRYQGLGYGGYLVRDVLRQFSRQGLQAVTVNTQGDNERGKALYRQLGFRPSGREFPVYQLTL